MFIDEKYIISCTQTNGTRRVCGQEINCSINIKIKKSNNIICYPQFILSFILKF